MLAVGTAVYLCIASLFLEYVDQDAWIYFTYFKRFFDLPFSYQPGHVAFGATSPLHVAVMAPVYHLGGEHWLLAAKWLNLVLVLAGIALVHRASRTTAYTFPLLVVACLAFQALMQSTATLFETGITFFLVSTLIWLAESKRDTGCIVVAGLLHLARPELIAVTGVVFAAIAWRQKTLPIRWFAISLVPVAVYYGYMWALGAGLVPTSVIGRAILAVEVPAPWSDKLSAVVRDPHMPVYGIALALTFVAAVVEKARVVPALWVVLPPVALYAAVVPGYTYYMPRYLAPTIPGYLFCVALIVDAIGRRLGRWLALSVQTRGLAAIAVTLGTTAVAAGVLYDRGTPWSNVGYTSDMILQKDLALAVRDIVRPNDRVLMYEIQAQYHFPAFAVSADGIVGREVHDFLLRRHSFDDLLERERISYLVTFNAFTYRRIYAGTPLVDIYQHDLASPVGGTICRGQHCFEKIATNPHFSSKYVELPVGGLNVGSSMRVYSGASDPRLYGQIIQWNSVYRVRPASSTSRS
jgi:hypothetical protein